MALPSDEEQEQLLAALAGLVRRAGPEALVSSPLALADPAFFPEAWSLTAAGVRAPALRMLALAGLGHLDVRVVVGQGLESTRESEPGVGAIESRSHHEGACAWFAGIEGGACLFGVDQSMLADPEGAVAALAHEVAHAFRSVKGLVDADARLEELLTDVTTIYLGFGVLTTNGAYRYRARGELSGGLTYTYYSHASQGYLAPESMAFLLAAQVVARGAEAGEARRVERRLETNQAAAFASACKKLRDSRSSLLQKLGLPESAAWPAPRPLAEVFAHLPAPPAAEPAPAPQAPEPEEAAEEPVPSNKGRRVFRVRNDRRGRGAMLGGLAGMALAAAVQPVLSAALLLLLGGSCAGHALGRRRAFFVCSNLQCKALIGAEAHCPSCQGTVAGDIAHADDRLAAEEALDGEGDQSPPRRGGTFRALRVIASLVFLLIVGALGFSAWSAYFANEVRVHFAGPAAAGTVSVDGGPAVNSKGGVAHLALRSGERHLSMVASGQTATLTLQVKPDSRHAARASSEVCFVALDGRGYYGTSGPRVGGVRERFDQDHLELADLTYFFDTLPAKLSYSQVTQVRVLVPCHCSLLHLPDDEILARVTAH
jgi:hypothetical protein